MNKNGLYATNLVEMYNQIWIGNRTTTKISSQQPVQSSEEIVNALVNLSTSRLGNVDQSTTQFYDIQCF